jgi:hypothetical protein
MSSVAVLDFVRTSFPKTNFLTLQIFKQNLTDQAPTVDLPSSSLLPLSPATPYTTTQQPGSTKQNKKQKENKKNGQRTRLSCEKVSCLQEGFSLQKERCTPSIQGDDHSSYCEFGKCSNFMRDNQQRLYMRSCSL